MTETDTTDATTTESLIDHLAARDIRKGDSVHVADVARFTDRLVPYVGTVVEINDETETVRVTNHDDDHRPDLVEPAALERTFGSQAEACAFLAARKMATFCQAHSEGKLVRAWIDDGGKNFSNVGNAFDLDTGEIGPLEAYNEETRAAAPEWATTYANFIARGLRDPDTDGWGYGTPTHAPGRAEAIPKDPDDLEDIVIAAASSAGIDLEP